MLGHYADPANAITGIGLMLTVLGLALAVSGFPDQAVAVVLWALLADHLDGVVAKRTANRAATTGMVGKNLDSLADLVSAGVFPAVLLITLNDAALWSIIPAVLLVMASALRLSYFNVHGLKSDRFVGVPTTYAVPATAAFFLLQPWMPAEAFGPLFAAILTLVALLQITPVSIPKTEGFGYLAITVFCVGASITLALR